MKTTHSLLLTALLTLAACGPEDSRGRIGGDDTLDTAEGELARIPSEDFPTLLDVGSWNVEWFGDPEEGPTDERVQFANVRTVLRRMELDVVGLVEVVDAQSFALLMQGLPAYEGVLVTDPRVENGSAYYASGEQKVALLFKKKFHLDSARVVVTNAAYDFAGRPPMEVKLSWTEDGAARSLVVVVAHFKAMANYDGWNRRTRASAAFKTWLDTTYPTRWVLVVGDLNDDIDVSTYQRRVSPFSNFVDDSAHYQFTTAALSQAGVSTTASFSSTIDHHLATDELARRFVPGSAKVVRADSVVPNFSSNTSDHFPVITRYDLR
ncbi:MAG: endonuclease/exonuclease/phosphatase family protein [Archangium sp.]|nr:endonuclease/exonuclease/phosphatase family protein [Archangium sp.]